VVAAGGTASVTIVATASANATASSRSFDNNATVSATTGDDNTGNDTSNTVSTTQAGVGATADLTVSKQGPGTVSQVGGDLTYTITVTHKGNTGSTGVVVHDTLASGLTLKAAGSSAGCSAAGPVVPSSVGVVAAGGTASVTIVATASANSTTSSRSFDNSAT